jgi:hypothetical protein
MVMLCAAFEFAAPAARSHIAQVARILEKLMLLLLPDAPSLKLYRRRSCVIGCRWGCSFFTVVGCAALSAATTAATDALMARR